MLERIQGNTIPNWNEIMKINLADVRLHVKTTVKR